jgi:hypothetical protein
MRYQYLHRALTASIAPPPVRGCVTHHGHTPGLSVIPHGHTSGLSIHS